MVKGLIINTNGSLEEYGYDNDYLALQEIVEGYIEPISFGDKPYFAYCNEEGKITELAENKVATELWYDSGQVILLGDYIAGNVVFFGLIDKYGNDTDYPQQLLDDLKRYGVS